MQQIGALPYRTGPGGDIEILLVTTRSKKRWIVPKGNPIEGLKAHQVAAREAFEEAGVSGNAFARSVGMFHYTRRRAERSDADVEVTVFPILVSEEHDEWPERQQRERRWLDPIAASHLVDDMGLKRLLQIFHLTART